MHFRALLHTRNLKHFRPSLSGGFRASVHNYFTTAGPLNMENHHVVLKSRPGVSGVPKAGQFSCEPCSPVEALRDGEILIKTCYLSVDPAQRAQMNEETGAEYVSPWGLGETIEGFAGIGSVLESNHTKFLKGDLVYGAPGFPWKRYFNVDINILGDMYQKLDKSLYGSHPSMAISLMGYSGLTAYFGLRDKGHIKRGSNQTCVVSGAAGSCGSLAGQIAKIDGCERVIGICGTKEKCEWIVKDLGFDAAINYRSEDVGVRIRELCPGGVHVYFDNVGGSISDHVIENMVKDSHVVLCGQIALYNQDVPHIPPLPKSTSAIIKERNITREDFLVLDYADKYEAGLMDLKQWHFNGQIKVQETVTSGLENTGEAFASMMSGGNIGKQIVHVADP